MLLGLEEDSMSGLVFIPGYVTAVFALVGIALQLGAIAGYLKRIAEAMEKEKK